MFWFGIGTLFTLFCFLFPLPSLFPGEIYRWVDEKGGVHLTDDISKVPDGYRSQVEKREVTEEVSKQDEKRILPERGRSGPAFDAEPQVKPEKKHDRVKEFLEAIEEKIEAKRKIEKRISKLQEEMQAADERIKQLEKDEQENYPLMQPYGAGRTFVPVGTPHYREKVRLTNRIKDIKEEIVTLERRLSEIKRTL